TIPPPLAYLTVPLLVWATFRFGLHGAATALFLLSAVAVLGTVQGTGPFVQPTVSASLLLLQVFMGVIAVTALVLAGVLNRRPAAEQLLRASRDEIRLVTDHAPALLVRCDRERRYRFANKPYTQRFGLEPQDVVGKCIPEVVGQQAYERFRSHVD